MKDTNTHSNTTRTKISKTKLELLNNNPLINNNDIKNKERYLKLSQEDLSKIKEEVLLYIKTDLTKSNGHLNIERITNLNKWNRDIFKNICILTYFCNNHKELTLLNRIKMLRLNITELDYCTCGKLKKISNNRNEIFLPSCGNPECYYKVVGKASKKNKDLINTIRTKNLIENKEAFNIELSDFLNNLSSFIPIDIDTFKTDLIEKYKTHLDNKECDQCVLGTNRSHLQFKNNETFIKNLIFYTPYIQATTDSLNINQRIYHIINSVNVIPKCKICKTEECSFISIKQGYCEYCSKLCHKNFIYNKLSRLLKSNGYTMDSTFEEFTEKIFRIKHDKCGTVLNTNKFYGKCMCGECFPFINSSKAETDIITFIHSLNKDLEIQQSNRTLISPLELDIVIPAKKLAIEFNGNYWHSELQGKDEFYHLNKTRYVNKEGYKLIHIFEDEWVYQTKIVKSRIKNILGLTSRKIYARKCEVREIDSTTKNMFLNHYHIQGSDVSSLRYGLFFKNRLVAVMTFGKRRFDNKEGYELMRYATISNFNIIGGAGKLLAHFKTLFPKETVISYCDRRWSEGNLYKQLGFILVRESNPSYFYINCEDILTRHNRINFQKHKLKDKLAIFDENLTEYENMITNGYTRIYDCGTLVFELKSIL